VPTEATFAVTFALVAPASTVALAGTVTIAFPLVNETASPPAGAAPVKLTVQVEVPGALTVAGLQLSVLSWLDGVTVTLADLLTPFVPAVMVTLFALATVPAVTVMVCVFAPAATAVFAGTGNALLSLDRFTRNPLPVAAFVKDTVQEVVCPLVTLAGVHTSDDSTGSAETFKVEVLETPAAVAVSSAV
jgi:hypothetical protein